MTCRYEFCGAEVENRRSQYCSKRCYLADVTGRTIKDCAFCSKPFVADRKAKHCSPDCSLATRRVKGRERRRVERERAARLRSVGIKNALREFFG